MVARLSVWFTIALSIALNFVCAELHSSGCLRGLVVRHVLRKAERSRGQDLAPHMNEKYFGGKEMGSRPRIVEGFFGEHGTGSCSHTNMEYVGGRETGSKPGKAELWPFPKRQVKLCQSVFSQRKSCLCRADSEGMGGSMRGRRDRPEGSRAKGTAMSNCFCCNLVLCPVRMHDPWLRFVGRLEQS